MNEPSLNPTFFLLGLLIGIAFGYFWHFQSTELYIVPRVNEIAKQIEILESNQADQHLRIRYLELTTWDKRKR